MSSWPCHRQHLFSFKHLVTNDALNHSEGVLHCITRVQYIETFTLTATHRHITDSFFPATVTLITALLTQTPDAFAFQTTAPLSTPLIAISP